MPELKAILSKTATPKATEDNKEHDEDAQHAKKFVKNQVKTRTSIDVVSKAMLKKQRADQEALPNFLSIMPQGLPADLLKSGEENVIERHHILDLPGGKSPGTSRLPPFKPFKNLGDDDMLHLLSKETRELTRQNMLDVFNITEKDVEQFRAVVEKHQQEHPEFYKEDSEKSSESGRWTEVSSYSERALSFPQTEEDATPRTSHPTDATFRFSGGEEGITLEMTESIAEGLRQTYMGQGSPRNSILCMKKPSIQCPSIPCCCQDGELPNKCPSNFSYHSASIKPDPSSHSTSYPPPPPPSCHSTLAPTCQRQRPHPIDHRCGRETPIPSCAFVNPRPSCICRIFPAPVKKVLVSAPPFCPQCCVNDRRKISNRICKRC